MYFTHLQTTLAGSVLGLLGGGMIYIAGQTGLVPALKSSPAVSMGGGTALGGAIAAITYSVCRVRRIEFEGEMEKRIAGLPEEEEFFDYAGPVPQYQEPPLPPSLSPSEKLQAFIPSSTPAPSPLIYREEFSNEGAVAKDEQITHLQPQTKEPEPSPWDEEFLSQPIQETPTQSNGGVKVIKSAFEDFV